LKGNEYTFWDQKEKISSMLNYSISFTYSYTSKYFSALIINSEIESVVQADAKSLFAEDENFTVKALKAVNEIIAVYRVDDQNIEMAIRLPPMFPLRKVDVNGVQKVGVDEKRWRAWLLAVSAIIVSQVK
jgi:hypothetical protein